MTLDYQLARMETTPRTDTKFACMAAESSAASLLKMFVVPSPPIMPLTILDEEVIMSEEEMMIGVQENISMSHNNNYTTPSSDDDDVKNSENNLDQLTNNISSANGRGGDVDDDSDDNFIDNSTQEEEVEEHLRTSYNSSNQQHQQQQYLMLPYQRPSRPPRRPRDVSWMATAILIIPTGLILPHIYYHRHNANNTNNTSNDNNDTTSSLLSSSWSDMASSNSAHSTILLSTLSALAISLIVLRLLYSHPGGLDGDNYRYKAITRLLLLANHCCLWLHVLQIILIYHYLSNVRSAILLPIALVIRDTLRKLSLPSSRTTAAHYRQQQQQFPQQQQSTAVTSVTTYHDRITFFRALAVSSLDVLSRSLRRTSFVRTLSILLLVQFACTYLWYSAIRTVLSSSESITTTTTTVATKLIYITWLLLVLLAGYWVTSIVCHLLGYVSAGGVSAWFRGQQVLIMERLKQQQQQQQEKRDDTTTINAEGMNEGQTVWQDDDNAEDDYDDDNAYQTADASAYATLSDFDEGLDDEYDDDEDPAEGHHHHPQQQYINKDETVKSFLLVGCTIGFGSVAQCGLLGGVAQILSTLIRTLDITLPPPDEFRGMEVSSTVLNDATTAQRLQSIVSNRWKKIDNAIRNFVRSHSDIAMSHVAAYFKSYQRAANDVATLIEISGKRLHNEQ
jgi:hypothetical protein